MKQDGARGSGAFVDGLSHGRGVSVMSGLVYLPKGRLRESERTQERDTRFRTG